MRNGPDSLFKWCFRRRRRPLSFLTPLLIGTLRYDDGDGNENVTKANRFNNQSNNFARASRFLVHFFAVTARLRLETGLISRCTEEVHKRRRNYLPLSELGYGSLEFNLWRVRLYMSQSKWLGVIAIKIEKTRIHEFTFSFFSDVFSSVAVLGF